MKKPALVILAAGLGSRYGGLKQIDTVGNNGETIIDFSIYDAYKAGFRKVILIIRKEHEELFEQQVVKKIRPFMEVIYAYQDVKDLPEPFICPAERTKPWGTVQALLACRPFIDEPFMIINADDFYGKESYKIMYDFLTNEIKDDTFGMVGYQLTKTLTDHGAVTRGICKIEDGYLVRMEETQKIIRKDEQPYAISENGEEILLEDGLASMNFWGFTPAIFPYFEQHFKEFLNEKINVPKSEFVVPVSVGRMIDEGDVKVKVMSTNATWFGVTYPQDKEMVVNNILAYKAAGIYSFDIWANEKAED